jgi:phosphomethylpyrimidine synthase
MKAVALSEGVTPEFVQRHVAGGQIVIPVSPYRKVKAVGIGKGLRTKVNASIGTSSDKEACTMCGDYCALKIVKANLNL